MDGRPKIEVVRVSSTERRNFRPLDGVQLRAAYSHVRIGTYCPDIEIENLNNTCDNKPPAAGIGQFRRFKKNLGPVSRLLRRRHQGAFFATKSCDNIYSVKRTSGSMDWRMGQSVTEPELLASRQSSSLDWRVSRNINCDRLDASRSAEQLSRTSNFTSSGLHTPSAKSKIVSLLRRLSPRMPRPGTKTSVSGASMMGSSPVHKTGVCPWIKVEYSSESVNETTQRRREEESQESDVSFQRELQLNELKKRMLGGRDSGGASPLRLSSPKSTSTSQTLDDKHLDENANTGSPRINKTDNKSAGFDQRIYSGA